MARLRKSALAFDAITLEGSLISPAKLAEVAERRAGEQSEADYHIPKGLTLRDETARYFRIGQALFRELFTGANPSHQATIRFTQELLRDVFGFADIQLVTGPQVKDDRTYVLHLEALQGRAPVVVVPPSDDLDHASTHLSNERRRSAATAIQDWLNAEENALWGLCCNGERLRLLRDNESLTRPAYIEANLRQLFEAEDFAGFAALWLMLHASRFGRPAASVTDCALERWREAGGKEGVTARARLSVGVKDALQVLGNGFLSHPENAALRDRLIQGQLPLPDFFNELLRLVYRLIFLLAAEDRDLLHPPDAPAPVRKLYADGYSLGALRDGAIRRSGWDQFHDRWDGLRVVFRALAHGESRLGLPALGGLFDERETPNLNHAHLANRALMEAVFRLAWLREDSSILPVNWRDMETEELGSVYEGLLELTPRLTHDGRSFAFAEGLETKGNERKKSGSYYTPDSLVQALLDSALDPVLNRVESEAEDAVSGLLGITVIDPACGSGHFLLAAARRIATRVARARTQGVASAADYRHALRDAVRCCIHGVDRNPMAIELAKVALWIETVEPGKPLGFLDANLRVGDSLLGIFSLGALDKGIPDAAYKALAGDDKTVAKDFEKRNRRFRDIPAAPLDFSRSGPKPLALLASSFRRIRSLPENTVEEVEAKQAHYRSVHSEADLTRLERAANVYIAAFLTPKTTEISLDLQTSPVPTTDDVWTLRDGGQIYGPRLGAAVDLAIKARAFHWPLEFPDVMASGGFHVVLGNPPWERIKIQEQEFFASREPDISAAPNAAARGRMIQRLKNADTGTRERLLYEEFQLTKRIAEASSEFVRLKSKDAGRFPLTGRGDVNTYALFAELFSTIVDLKGRVGILVPTGIVFDDNTKYFFRHQMEHARLARLVSFYEVRQWFPNTDDRKPFCIMILGQTHGAADFIFDVKSLDELLVSERTFSLDSKEVAVVNPLTLTAPVFVSRADAKLSTKIYSQIPILAQATGDAPRWNFKYLRMIDMATDSGLFRTSEQLSDVPSVPTYVPLVEAKMCHIFDHRWNTYESATKIRSVEILEKMDPHFESQPRYWVPREVVDSALSEANWDYDWLIGWRDIVGSEGRTLIPSLVPKAGVNNKLLLLLPQHPVPLIAALYGCLASLTCDYVAKQKVGGSSLNYFVMDQIAVLPPTAFASAALDFIVPRILELSYTSRSLGGFARDLGYDGPPFAWNCDRRALLRAELDAWYARAYGLSRDELRYILDPADAMGPHYPSETFRVLKNNEMKRHGEYRTQRLMLEAWDRLELDRKTQVAMPKSPTRIDIDPFRLPAKHWAAASTLPAYTVTQLAAIIHRLPGPTPISQVRLASLFALEPQLLTRRLQGNELDVWLRLVGDMAQPPSGANVVTFAPKINAAWGKAVTQLRGMGEIVEDLNAGTWSEGSRTSQYQIPEWADGRADFVLRVVAKINIDVLTADLSSEDRAWVIMANVA